MPSVIYEVFDTDLGVEVESETILEIEVVSSGRIVHHVDPWC